MTRIEFLQMVDGFKDLENGVIAKPLNEALESISGFTIHFNEWVNKLEWITWNDEFEGTRVPCAWVIEGLLNILKHKGISDELIICDSYYKHADYWGKMGFSGTKGDSFRTVTLDTLRKGPNETDEDC